MVKSSPFSTKRILLISVVSVAGAAVTIASAYGFFAYQKLAYEKSALEEQVVVLQKISDNVTANLVNEKDTNQKLAEANQNLGETLQSEQSKNQMFSSQIQQISGTVGKLDKLSKTPPELLKKYSKVYFLNEHYIPTTLDNIDNQYLFDKGRAQQILAPVAPFLARMLGAASSDGKALEVVSAYRSFGDQTSVKTGYKVLYGSGANQFSADQGYSEHQLGTTVDLTTSEVDGLFTKFDASPAYAWLAQNAHRYGFTLSYPKGNGYYEYEPWHWRFVGVALATQIHDQNVRFYDLLQGHIDQYLISIFD